MSRVTLQALTISANMHSRMEAEEPCSEFTPGNDDDHVCTSEWDIVRESEYIKMPAGEYYVGDMAYVLRPEMIRELSQHQRPSDEKILKEGKFELSDGRRVVSFFQSGTQPDRYNDVIFQIQSGSIGMTLLDGLQDQWVAPPAVFVVNSSHKKRRTVIDYENKTMMEYIAAVGTVVVYDKDFVCSKCTCRHSNDTDETESIYFGDKVDIFSVNGTFDLEGETCI
jgi:hypothetical protein